LYSGVRRRRLGLRPRPNKEDIVEEDEEGIVREGDIKGRGRKVEAGGERLLRVATLGIIGEVSLRGGRGEDKGLVERIREKGVGVPAKAILLTIYYSKYE